jgi:hypothetical protein
MSLTQHCRSNFAQSGTPAPSSAEHAHVASPAAPAQTQNRIILIYHCPYTKSPTQIKPHVFPPFSIKH